MTSIPACAKPLCSSSPLSVSCLRISYPPSKGLYARKCVYPILRTPRAPVGISSSALDGWPQSGENKYPANGDPPAWVAQQGCSAPHIFWKLRVIAKTTPGGSGASEPLDAP